MVNTIGFSCKNLVGTIRNTDWFKIDRKMLNTIGFRWNQKELCLVSNQSANDKYNLISVDLARFRSGFICVRFMDYAHKFSCK